MEGQPSAVTTYECNEGREKRRKRDTQRRITEVETLGISGLHYRWLIAGVAGHQFSSVMIFHFGCWCPLLLSQTICLWEHSDSHKSVPSPLSADVPLALILMRCFFFASLGWMFGLLYVQELLIVLHTGHCVVFKLANNPQDYLQDDSFPGLNTRYMRLAEPATWKKRETSSQTRKKPSRLQHKHWRLRTCKHKSARLNS